MHHHNSKQTQVLYSSILSLILKQTRLTHFSTNPHQINRIKRSIVSQFRTSSHRYQISHSRFNKRNQFFRSNSNNLQVHSSRMVRLRGHKHKLHSKQTFSKVVTRFRRTIRLQIKISSSNLRATFSHHKILAMVMSSAILIVMEIIMDLPYLQLTTVVEVLLWVRRPINKIQMNCSVIEKFLDQSAATDLLSFDLIIF